MISTLRIASPTVFGDAFNSINMQPPFGQTITLLNLVVDLISEFRWSFYGTADVDVAVSLAAIVGFPALCLTAVWWIFRTGYKLKS